MRKRDYLELAVVGGFPEAVRRTPRRRGAFFSSYLSTLIERDVLEVSSIERQGDMLRLLSLLAGRVSGLLVPGTLAGQAGIPRTTLVRYLELLATVFLIKTIPAWSSGQTARAIGTPKLAFVDSGIVCHLIGQDAARLDEPDGAAGPVLENFVVMELARQLTWADERARLYHYRTKDKLEVDAVIETPDGRVIAVEVKAARPSELRTSPACGTWRATSATSSSPGMSSIPASRLSLTAAGSRHCRWTRSGTWHREPAGDRPPNDVARRLPACQSSSVPAVSGSTPKLRSWGRSRRLRLSSAKPGKPARPVTWSQSRTASCGSGAG